MNKDWDEHWVVWKSGKFMDLETDDMDTMANNHFKKFTRLQRELRVSGSSCSLETCSNTRIP